MTTRPNISHILDKIKKLLALSASSNPNEAARAAAKAQALLAQYNLELSQVEAHSGETSDYCQQDVAVGGVSRWRKTLMLVVARPNFCDVVSYKGTERVSLIGEPHNLEVVKYLYGYLVRQLEPMAATAYRQSGSSMHSRTWKDSFFHGAIASIDQRLKEQAQVFADTSEQSRALVVVKDAELRAAMKRYHPNVTPGQRKRLRSQDGYQQGREAGRRLALHKAIPSA
jgi:hypothetical protein